MQQRTPKQRWSAAAARLADALKAAGHVALFDQADADDIQDTFDDLRTCQLEPSNRLGVLYQQANPSEVSIAPWIYDTLDFIHIRDLADVHRGVAWHPKKKRRLAESWRGRWIIIALSGRDPYFVNASLPEMPVYTDTYGLWAWRPQQVASTLEGFFDLCVLWTESFIQPGLHPELAVYHEQRDTQGLERTQKAWRSFLRELKRRDPQAFEAGFWTRGQR
ncbi:MAG: hypothetical protein AAFS10_05555 [Myxococcota bacterium]